MKIKLLPEQGANPLKPLNFRYSGKPTPEFGVEVERKWKPENYSSRQMVTTLRIALFLGDLLSSIDADKLHAAISNARKEPSSLSTIGKEARSKTRAAAWPWPWVF